MRTSLAVLILAACGGGTGKPATPAQEVPEPAAEVAPAWAGWKDWHRVSTAPWVSKTHGKRLVEIYVNDVAVAAYQDQATALPVGSIIVKPSWENQDGQPGAPGPVFVMEKRPAGFSHDHGDWFYAFQWDAPTGVWRDKLGAGPVLWQSPSSKVDYCWDCHDTYDRQLGMPPATARAWSE